MVHISIRINIFCCALVTKSGFWHILNFTAELPVKFKMNFRLIGTRMCTQPLFQLLLLHAMMSSSRLVILNYPIAVVC